MRPTTICRFDFSIEKQSQFGTFVNKVQYIDGNPHDLTDGDRIGLGVAFDETGVQIEMSQLYVFEYKKIAVDGHKGNIKLNVIWK